MSAMIKSLALLLVRAATGYLVVTLIFMAATSQDIFPADAYTAPAQTLYHWFYFATIVAWVAAVVLAVGDFAGFSSKKTAPWLAWAPLWLPPIYALISAIVLLQILPTAAAAS